MSATQVEEKGQETVVLSKEEQQQKQIAENILEAYDGQDAVEEPEEGSAQEEKPAQEEPKESASAPTQPPQGSPASPPGVDPGTGFGAAGAGYRSMAPALSPAVIQQARMVGMSDQMIGQLGSDQNVQAYMAQMRGGQQAPPQFQPPQGGFPQQFEPFKAPDPPDVLDDQVAAYGKRLAGGFDHMGNHVAGLYSRLGQVEAAFNRMMHDQQMRHENQAADWFDRRVRQLADSDDTWAQRFGKGAFGSLTDVRHQQERQAFKDFWDSLRFGGHDFENAFTYSQNARYANVMGQLHARQSAIEAEKLASGAGVPPAGQAPGKSGEGDQFAGEFAKVKRKAGV